MLLGNKTENVILRIVKLLIFVFVLSVFTNSSAAELTEEAVKNLISKVDSAVNALNVQGVADALGSDVEIIMHISSQGQSQVIRPSKQEYLAMLEQGWAMFTDYKFSRSNLVIEMQENKAFVTVDTRESMIFQGQKISGQSKEEFTIEIVNGAPLVAGVITHSSM